jgi:hypothetical protein
MQRSAIGRIWLPALVSLLCAGMVTGQARADDPTIAAVGDMGCSPYDPSYNGGAGTATACRQRYVSDLLVDPALVALLDLGDNQYDNGELANYWAVYNPTFGRANAIVYPSLGNADYGTPNAQGFFDYFSAVGVTARITGGSGDASHFPGAAYYSFDIGAWHVIALNSNCADVGGCDAGSPQEQWLKSDLAAHPNHCTLAYWHHPRWNSGMLGNDPSTAAFWTDLYNAGADIVLNGHANHHYERFGPQNPAGAPDLNEGIREFIVSTGGQSHGPPAGAQQPRHERGLGLHELRGAQAQAASDRLRLALRARRRRHLHGLRQRNLPRPAGARPAGACPAGACPGPGGAIATGVEQQSGGAAVVDGCSGRGRADLRLQPLPRDHPRPREAAEAPRRHDHRLS